MKKDSKAKKRWSTWLAIAGLAVAVSSSPVLAAPASPLGVPIDVTAGVPGSAEGSTAVARNAAGDFVVAWSQRLSVGGSVQWSLLARRFSAEGQPLGSLITAQQVSIPDSLTLANPFSGIRVGISSSGSFLLAWRRPSASFGFGGGTERISYLPVSAAGVPSSFVRTAQATPGVLHSDPSLAMNERGQWIISWVREEPEDAASSLTIVAGPNRIERRRRQVVMVRELRSGFTTMPEVVDTDPALRTVFTDQALYAFEQDQGLGATDVAINESGESIIAWNRNRVSTAEAVPLVCNIPGATEGVSTDICTLLVDSQSAQGSVHVRRYGSDGNPRGLPALIDRSSTSAAARSGQKSVPAVAMDDAGNSVVAWVDNAVPSLNQQLMFFTEVRAQRLDARGRQRGLEILIGSVDRDGQSSGRVATAVATDGSFVVVAAARSNNAWLFNNDGLLLGVAGINGLGAADTGQRPDVAMNARGDFVTSIRAFSGRILASSFSGP